jgi:3-isopropylmalate dehydrogenase
VAVAETTNNARTAAEAALRIERAVDKAYAGGIKPMEYGGRDGTVAIANAVMQALG